jgi:hypothetical protein
VTKSLKAHGVTLGPSGILMRGVKAFALDARLRALPAEDRVAHKAILPAAVRELAPGERADVSWITTEAVDGLSGVLVTELIGAGM